MILNKIPDILHFYILHNAKMQYHSIRPLKLSCINVEKLPKKLLKSCVVNFCLSKVYVKEVKPPVKRKNNKNLDENKLFPNWLSHV